jgi:hypothetical protein
MAASVWVQRSFKRQLVIGNRQSIGAQRRQRVSARGAERGEQ